MVATRGGARTSGGNTMETLKKKPVRKTATKPAPTAAKSKTTRAKKAEPVQETPDVDDEQDELQEESTAPTAKPTRRAPAKKAEEDAPKPAKKAISTRVKKDEEPAKAPAAKPAAKVGRPKGSTKTVKDKPAEKENQKPELPPPAEPKGTRATRATASTAAKGRAPPLSPKKITQVAKVPPKTTKSATAKAALTKAPVNKAAPKGRPVTRKRTVSDENAGVTNLPSTKQALEEDVEKKPDKKATEKTPKKVEAVEEEITRPITPTTPREVPEDHMGDDAEPEDQDHDAAAETDGDSDSDAPSVDELLGPKTPLKRCSPREATRFTSAQKSVPRLDASIRTPVRRFAVLGTQQGTPQTQKPYCKPSIPMSEVRPMTVARARDRAMVFPKLQPLPKLKDNEDIEDWEESDTPEEQDAQMKVTEDLSMSEAEDDEVPAVLGDLEETMSHMQESELLEIEDEEHEPQINDEPDLMSGGEDLAEVEEHEELGQDFDTEHAFTNDETKVGARDIEALEEDIGPLHETNDELEAEDIDIPMEDAPTTDSTPQPETLVWENVRESITIPFNFEVDLSASRTLPPVEPTERLSLASALETESSAEPEADSAAVELDTKEETMAEDTADLSVARDNEQLDAHTSLDATVDLSDFLDIKSLADSKPQDQQEEAQADPVEAEPVPVEVAQADDECSPSPLKAHATPARDFSELDIALEDIQDDAEYEIPRYARPTIASRRKSLPAIFYRTPTKDFDRPMTAIGASMPRVAVPYGNYLFANASTPSKVTPARPRPSTAHGLASEKKLRKASQTPITGSPAAKTPSTSVPGMVHIRQGFGSPSRTPRPRLSHAETPGTSVPESTRPTPRERFPGLPSRTSYDLENTPVSATPLTGRTIQAERFPGLPPQNSYESFAEDTQEIAMEAARESPSVRTPTVTRSAVKERYPGLPPSDTYAENLEATSEEQAEADAPSTPVPSAGERYPGLPSKRSYAEHAMTAMPTTRFRTPTQSPAKRPATARKPASLRKVALKASTPRRTPLKAPTMTPGMEPMTPHPAAPLKGVVALVEVFTSDGGCATPAFTVLLQRLGAKTTKTFSERITHLVFKEGSPTTLQRLRVHNKQVAETGVGKEIHCVNSRWVSDCDTESTRMDETDEAYAVDVEDVPRAGKRRRKSMEPTSLKNIGGNVVRDRKSTLGRSSLNRNSLKPEFESPSELEVTPKASTMDKENSGDDRSPATPAYLAAPDSLVQQTAPMNRVRKLDFKSKEAEKSRRLTFFSGEF